MSPCLKIFKLLPLFSERVKNMNTVIGELSLHYEGYGFVVPKKKGFADVFIPARLTGDALHGDLVEVKVFPSSKKGLFEGRIVQILERGLKQVVGRLEKHGNQWSVSADDKRVRHQMLLKSPPTIADHGDYVVAKIVQYPEREKPLKGEVIERLPERGSLMSEIEYVIAKHQWPKRFPKKVEEEAEALSAERGVVGISRKDLRHLPFVTIDGDDAKDFDDAICAQTLSGGKIRLWVAIADVSHYVTPGSVIDQEAYARSTSVYFPGRVLPMLPEVLSNDLCSLKPREDRLAVVAEMVIDAHGNCSEEVFYPAIFQSQARLTYAIVKKILEDKEAEFLRTYEAFLTMLETLSETAKRLKMQRGERGSLDFDLPEPEIILDFTGGISDVEKAERYWSHQIIEELMIAANEAVARFLTAKKTGCLYRIHEGPKPEKIALFYKLVQRLGYRGPFPNKMTAKGLQKILASFKGHSEERLVNTMMLRSMAQAVYSETNAGHFGLGSSCYCHFTSPIRRYPDLIVHRLIKTGLAGKKGLPQIKLQEMGEQTSNRERKAMGAEREMLSLHQTMFMKEKAGEIFEGIISHVTKFGFFVELLEYFVEGLVSKLSLKKEYLFDEEHLCLTDKKHKKVFKIGDRIKVEVGEVNIPERRIYFKLLDSVEPASLR